MNHVPEPPKRMALITSPPATRIPVSVAISIWNSSIGGNAILLRAAVRSRAISEVPNEQILCQISLSGVPSGTGFQSTRLLYDVRWLKRSYGYSEHGLKRMFSRPGFASVRGTDLRQSMIGIVKDLTDDRAGNNTGENDGIDPGGFFDALKQSGNRSCRTAQERSSLHGIYGDPPIVRTSPKGRFLGRTGFSCIPNMNHNRPDESVGDS